MFWLIGALALGASGAVLILEAAMHPHIENDPGFIEGGGTGPYIEGYRDQADRKRMAIGDVKWDSDGYGLKEVECDYCFGRAPDCDYCDGDGFMFEVIMPEHEKAEIFENIRRQMPWNKH